MTTSAILFSSYSGFNMTGPVIVGFMSVAMLVGGLGAWSTSTQLAGAVVASGTIEVLSNRQVIEHPDGGVVGDFYVRDGSRVEQGDILLSLDDTFLLSEKKIVELQLHELMSRKARLEAERDGSSVEDLQKTLSQLGADMNLGADLVAGQLRLFQARNETMAQEIDQLKQHNRQITDEIGGIEAQLDALDTQKELIQVEVSAQQSLLDKGLTPASRVSALKRELARLSGMIGQSMSNVARLEGQMSTVNIEILRLPASRREEAIAELRDLQMQIGELAERHLALDERLSRLDVRSPVSGLVFGNQVFARQSVINPGDPMMFVVPQQDELVIAANVDAVHVDQLQIGQLATLRFSAFNQRQTPELEGKVTNISADILTDEKTGSAFYQVDVVVDETQHARLNGQELLPGMPVEVFMKTDNRTPLSYFVKPMTDYFTRAFRG
ncbi:HlyD family type I secretion periplasmic adaptor subunit [uncultured Ruegeria sp.]|uniref:HlyD family type I secretion periplasmic adaptor subunit n=1 Tax=uncultured Ruegeria sp. TaxID=259304 RepID=UPI0026138873|nr:HlyD family type I secretion periplasmic adaptor subunit [uncultured Ruegeria sp.]